MAASRRSKKLTKVSRVLMSLVFERNEREYLNRDQLWKTTIQIGSRPSNETKTSYERIRKGEGFLSAQRSTDLKLLNEQGLSSLN